MKVCIVGAGVAGIQTAKVLAEYGHECHVFEKTQDFCGVWRSNYHGFGLQVPYELYEFRQFPVDGLRGTFPSGSEICELIRQYVKHYDLQNKCSFHFEEEV